MSRSIRRGSCGAFNVINDTDLNSPRGFGGAPADVEKTFAAGLALARAAGRPAQVDQQRVALKQAHKMGGFLALSDTNLTRHSSRLAKQL